MMRPVHTTEGGRAHRLGCLLSCHSAATLGPTPDDGDGGLTLAGPCHCAGSASHDAPCAPPLLTRCHAPRTWSWLPPSCMHGEPVNVSEIQQRKSRPQRTNIMQRGSQPKVARHDALQGVQTPVMIVARYGLDTSNTISVELCRETSLQDLSPHLGSTGRMRPTYAFKLFEKLLISNTRTPVGSIIRPKFQQMTKSCYYAGDARQASCGPA